MSTRIILVTGATDGIGKQTAIELAKKGAHVIVHGRNPEKVEAVRQAVEKAGAAKAEAVAFDLASFKSVRKGAEEIAKRVDRLDVLVNNAGVFMNERVVTEDGFETTFQVNHLAPFLLTRLLIDSVLKGPGARVVNVSSIAHRRGRLTLDDLQRERNYDGYGAYAQSKLANVFFTLEFANRFPPERITANALHPGVVGTKLLREGFGSSGSDSVEEGAETSVYLATSPEVEGVSGRYFVKCKEGDMALQALDSQGRKRLWEISEKMIGVGSTED